MLSEANNAFACDLYRQLASDNPSDNLFFSPYSMFNALAMCAEGARGTTAEELGMVLRLPEPVESAFGVPLPERDAGHVPISVRPVRNRPDHLCEGARGLLRIALEKQCDAVVVRPRPFRTVPRPSGARGFAMGRFWEGLYVNRSKRTQTDANGRCQKRPN